MRSRMVFTLAVVLALSSCAKDECADDLLYGRTGSGRTCAPQAAMDAQPTPDTDTWRRDVVPDVGEPDIPDVVTPWEVAPPGDTEVSPPPDVPEVPSEGQVIFTICEGEDENVCARAYRVAATPGATPKEITPGLSAVGWVPMTMFDVSADGRYLVHQTCDYRDGLSRISDDDDCKADTTELALSVVADLVAAEPIERPGTETVPTEVPDHTWRDDSGAAVEIRQGGTPSVVVVFAARQETGDRHHLFLRSRPDEPGGAWSAPQLLTSDSPCFWHLWPALAHDVSRLSFVCIPESDDDLYGYGDTEIGEIRNLAEGPPYEFLIRTTGGEAFGKPTYEADYAIVFANGATDTLDRLLPAGAPTPIAGTAQAHDPCVLPDARIAVRWRLLTGGNGDELAFLTADGAQVGDRVIPPYEDVAGDGNMHDNWLLCSD